MYGARRILNLTRQGLHATRPAYIFVPVLCLFDIVFLALKTTYHVLVRTGNKYGAGTDANVYIVLYGEIDDTG